MTNKSKILFFRHGEEPTFKEHIAEHGSEHDELKELEHEDSIIGLTLQGAVRTYFMPKIVKKLIGNNNFQLHTYTNYGHKKGNNVLNEPVSRSYYTSQLLRSSKKCDDIILYNKSDNVFELVENLLNASKKYPYIIVCWEHATIPIIIQHLLKLDHAPNYNEITKKFMHDKIKYKKTISKKKIESIKRSANGVENDNDKIKNEIIDIDKDMYYAPIWEIKINHKKQKNKYNVFPGITIENNKGDWTANYYF